jgi:hypothetical protein
MAKWIIGIIIVALLAGALWYSGVLGNMHMTPSQTASSTPTTATTTQATAQPIDGMSANNDASDAAITQDTAAIDTQMQGLNSDNANVTSSMNDKETPQSY